MPHQLDNLSKVQDTFQKLTECVEGYSIVLLDTKGTILTWNKGVQKIKGYSSDEIVGQNIGMFYLPLDREKGLPEKFLGEARSKGIANAVGQRVRKNGTIFWGSFEIASVKNSMGKVIGFTKLARELNEELDVDFFWFDNNGVLYTKACALSQTKEGIQEFREMLSAASKSAKICAIVDAKYASLTPEGKNYSIVSVLKLYKAIAFITDSDQDENTRILLSQIPTGIPTKRFKTRKEAKNWIKQFLQ